MFIQGKDAPGYHPKMMLKVMVYENKLYVNLYTLPTPKENEAVQAILQTLNDSQTKYPGTDLVLCYKTTTLASTGNQDL